MQGITRPSDRTEDKRQKMNTINTNSTFVTGESQATLPSGHSNPVWASRCHSTNHLTLGFPLGHIHCTNDIPAEPFNYQLNSFRPYDQGAVAR